MPTTLFHLITAAIGTALLTSGAVYGIVKLLLKPVWTALNGYATTYANGQASIDVRMRNLEKLAEEQARLTRTVESIKDEIAAQAKSRDNQWAFRKEVYVNILNASSGLLAAYSSIASFQATINQKAVGYEAASKMLYDQLLEAQRLQKEFNNYTILAPLAMADDVAQPVLDSVRALGQPLDLKSADLSVKIQEKITALQQLTVRLHSAGRKDLWGTTLPEVKAQAVQKI